VSTGQPTCDTIGLASASLIKMFDRKRVRGSVRVKNAAQNKLLEPYLDAIKVGCRWIAMSGMRAESRDTLFIPYCAEFT
jgi:hypothetical protein